MIQAFKNRRSAKQYQHVGYHTVGVSYVARQTDRESMERATNVRKTHSKTEQDRSNIKTNSDDNVQFM